METIAFCWARAGGGLAGPVSQVSGLPIRSQVSGPRADSRIACSGPSAGRAMWPPRPCGKGEGGTSDKHGQRTIRGVDSQTTGCPFSQIHFQPFPEKRIAESTFGAMSIVYQTRGFKAVKRALDRAGACDSDVIHEI